MKMDLHHLRFVHLAAPNLDIRILRGHMWNFEDYGWLAVLLGTVNQSDPQTIGMP